MGERIFKQGASGTTYFEPAPGGALQAEVRPNGVCIDYVWLNGRLVMVMTNSGQIYPVHDDQTGRPIAITNSQKSVIWAAQNLPFKSNVTTNVLGSAFGDFNIGFPGQYYDSESGLWYNGNRDYDANLGRYIESDPIGLAGGVNTYAYVGGNPVNEVDPLGLCDKKPNCDTVLPDGTTIGSHVAALSNQINSEASQMVATPYGPVLSSNALPSSVASQVYSGTNFKIMFRGQANAAFLGDAGNFAYGAVSANIGVPLIVAEGVAGLYASWAGHQDIVGPLGMDVSAHNNVPAGYAAACQNP